jgi:hypothetical protein
MARPTNEIDHVHDSKAQYSFSVLDTTHSNTVKYYYEGYDMCIHILRQEKKLDN